jgi:membrane-associated protease RseP (regulator of RpoE activity)
MSFIKYDLIFLAIFSIFIVSFLYKKRKNVGREGILFLYRTQIGVKFIEFFSNKFRKPLEYSQYLIISVGYLLMAGIIYLLGTTMIVYVRNAKEIVSIVKAPPIAPVIPYFPKLFGMESFFPPFYFTYFIIAIGIVAIVHEFSHGIMMRVHNIRIKSTGFAFLGPILGAFVEQDDVQMQKKSIKQQLSVLGAGVFANLITGILFLIILIGLFYVTLSPVGYVFTGYTFKAIYISDVSNLNLIDDDLAEVYVNETKYYFYKEQMKQIVDGELKPVFDEKEGKRVIVFEDSPAFNVKLKGIITEIDGVEIKSQKILLETLGSKQPGDRVEIKTIKNISSEGEKEIGIYQVELGKNPSNESLAYLGITSDSRKSNFVSLMTPELPSVYYEKKVNGDFLIFIYYLVFWIALINILVALFNMLPLGILDGGRFFYLTIFKITSSEKIAKFLFSAITYAILFGFALITLIWFFQISNLVSIFK